MTGGGAGPTPKFGPHTEIRFGRDKTSHPNRYVVLSISTLVFKKKRMTWGFASPRLRVNIDIHPVNPVIQSKIFLGILGVLRID